jgi:hypothetical protein
VYISVTDAPGHRVCTGLATAFAALWLRQGRISHTVPRVISLRNDAVDDERSNHVTLDLGVCCPLRVRRSMKEQQSRPRPDGLRAPHLKRQAG